MMRLCGFLGVSVLLSVAAFGESAGPNPKFDVTDVHNSPRATGPIPPVVRGPFYMNGRYELRFASMLDMIRIAYGVDPEKVTGGPSWLEFDRFDVFAKTPASSTPESRKQMLQSLLAERFKLVTHPDSKPMSAYALTVGKHPQLKESDGSGESGCNFNVLNQPTAPPSPGTPFQLPQIQYTCRNTSMATLAANMLNIPAAGQYLNNNTLVVDKTDLKGTWDFSFKFTPKIPPGLQTTGENIPFMDALDKQLGLKLEMTNVPMPVIVVDSVNHKPTENSAEAMKSFPPLPTEFEVASLKPTDPGTRPGQQRPDIKNGRLYLPGFSVKGMIQIAWDIGADEMLVGAPKWLDEDRYDLLAKTPDGVAMGNLTPDRSGIPVNIDALKPMIRSLVTERFKMVAHLEDRPVTAYTLTAVKPKLKKADPNSRTKWQEGVQPEEKNNKNANTTLGRLVTCQNVTMAQFAEMLPNIAPGYLRTEVKDSTGLEGGWDFTFSFTPIGALNNARRPNAEGGAQPGGPGGPGGPGSVEASDPTASLSLYESISRQLGLKLDTTKRPMPVLVIEKIERTPTEN
jgi:uncharacterized protein (TIGR03435 family)